MNTSPREEEMDKIFAEAYAAKTAEQAAWARWGRAVMFCGWVAARPLGDRAEEATAAAGEAMGRWEEALWADVPEGLRGCRAIKMDYQR